MKKLKFLSIFLLISILASFALTPSAFAVEDPGVLSSSVLLVELNTNMVFYSKNETAKVYPASLTKIMTVLLATEAIEDGRVSPYDEVTASENMSYDLIDDGSTVGIVSGETMSLENLMYCALVKSANEACNIIAEYIGGTISDFIDMMNTRAAELGCTGTHFANAHGCPNDAHYTTAYDMYLIASEAVTHPLFYEICNTTYREIPATNYSEARYLTTTNGLLTDDAAYSGYYYEYAKGVKTGHTDSAGYCLISTAEKDDIRMMAVVMGGVVTDKVNEDGSTGQDISSFSDSIKLYNWGFENFSYQDVLKSTTLITELPVSMGADGDSVILHPQSSISTLLPNDTDVSDFERETVIYSEQEGEELVAPISAGDVLGEITVSKDGVSYGKTYLVAANSVELSKIYYIKTEIGKALDHPIVKLVFWILVLLFCCYLALVILYRVKRKRHVESVRALKREREAARSEAALQQTATVTSQPRRQPMKASVQQKNDSPTEAETEDDFLRELFKK